MTPTPVPVSADRESGRRIEHDMLGEVAVPAAAYYGAHTARALENFPISGEPLAVRPHLVTE